MKFRILLILVLILVSPLIWARTVFLNNGQKINGKILSVSNNSVSVFNQETILEIKKSEISYISESDSLSENIYNLIKETPSGIEILILDDDTFLTGNIVTYENSQLFFQTSTELKNVSHSDIESIVFVSDFLKKKYSEIPKNKTVPAKEPVSKKSVPIIIPNDLPNSSTTPNVSSQNSDQHSGKNITGEIKKQSSQQSMTGEDKKLRDWLFLNKNSTQIALTDKHNKYSSYIPENNTQYQKNLEKVLFYLSGGLALKAASSNYDNDDPASVYLFSHLYFTNGHKILLGPGLEILTADGVIGTFNFKYFTNRIHQGFYWSVSAGFSAFDEMGFHLRGGIGAASQLNTGDSSLLFGVSLFLNPNAYTSNEIDYYGYEEEKQVNFFGVIFHVGLLW
jgi:sRNA-binding regulator protein Hfq